MEVNIDFELIVTIVNKGDASKVVEASRRAGAEGGTIVHGRGIGIREKAMLFGIRVEPEKDIVLTLIPKENTQQVLTAIVEAAQLNKPGYGIAFVVDVARVAGICHLCI